jgi:hypothetical protein
LPFEINTQEAIMFSIASKITISSEDFVQTMAVVLFLIGLVALSIGIFTLAKQAVGKYVQIIAEQTTKLAQKGIAEDVAGLVGNASSLLAALNQLVRSNAGIGIILSLIGFILLGSAYALITSLTIP